MAMYRKSRCGLFFVLAVALLSGAGCVTGGDELRTNMEALRMDTFGQRNELTQLKAKVVDLEQTLATLKEQNLGALRESQSSLLGQTTDLSKEVQLLKGRFDESRYFTDKALKDSLSERELQLARIASLENELKELRGKFTALTTELAQAKEAMRAVQEKQNQQEAAPRPDSAQQAGASAQGTGTPQGMDSASAQRFYDDAQIDLKEKRFAAAREKFERFLSDFPQHALAPNASFWIAESYYAEKRYEDAILSHESFLKKYPDHEKARGAILKQAYSFIELGDRKTGKALLERVIEKYPQSPEAELAEKRIAELLAVSSKNSAPKPAPPSKNTGKTGKKTR